MCVCVCVCVYHGGVVLLQPRRKLGAEGQDLEQRGSEGTVVVAPHSPQAAEPLGHLRITLQQQQTWTPQEVIHVRP